MSVTITEMERKYLGDALGVYRWYVLNSTATFQIAEPSESQMESILFFDTSRYRSFALIVDGIFAGYGIVTRFKPREAFDRTAEVTLYLAQHATGKGYGPRLLAHLEDFARSREMHSLVALVTGSNVPSVALFERAQYAKCAHFHEVGFKFGQTLDLVCFEKLL
jgi:L-amino acid N-acyltransferase YncA